MRTDLALLSRIPSHVISTLLKKTVKKVTKPKKLLATEQRKSSHLVSAFSQEAVYSLDLEKGPKLDAPY